MNEKFTPGTWKIVAASFDPELDIMGNQDVVSYSIAMPGRAVISKANSDLIASAPELYAENQQLKEELASEQKWAKQYSDENDQLKQRVEELEKAVNRERKMTTNEVIENYSKVNGYDGLFNESLGCGCFNGELMNCEVESPDCEFGYKHICKSCEIDCIMAQKEATDLQCPACGVDIQP